MFIFSAHLKAYYFSNFHVTSHGYNVEQCVRCM